MREFFYFIIINSIKMTSEYFEKLHVATINQIPIQYVAFGANEYLLLSNYLPPNPTISNLLNSIQTVKPLLNRWLINVERYVIEYFRNVEVDENLTRAINDKLTSIGENTISRSKYLDKYKLLELNQSVF